MIARIGSYIGAAVILMVLGAYLARTYYPRVETRTEVVEKEVIKKDVVTVVREVKRPDGTTETETTVTDRSSETKNRQQTTVQIKPEKPKYLVSAGISKLGIRSSDEPWNIYSAQVSMRVLGPVFLGVTANTQKEAGVLLTVEF